METNSPVSSDALNLEIVEWKNTKYKKKKKTSIFDINGKSSIKRVLLPVRTSSFDTSILPCTPINETWQL